MTARKPLTDEARDAELAKLRDEVSALIVQATRLAEKVIAIIEVIEVIDERVPEPPGRRKRHLRVLPGPGERSAGLC